MLIKLQESQKPDHLIIQKQGIRNNQMNNEERILRERYISPEQRQKIIDGIRLRWKYKIMEYQKIITCEKIHKMNHLNLKKEIGME